MRYLLFHADRIRYKALRPALRSPPDPPGEYEAGPAVVVFVSVERGDDEWVVEAAARDIVEYASERVREERVVLYPYAHLSSDLARPGTAHRLLVLLEGRVRELFGGEVVRAPFGWYKEFEIRVKGHPLSELSRQIRREGLARVGGLVVGSVEDAVQAGLVPRGVRAEPLLEGLAREKVGLLGLECGRWEALHYLWRISWYASRIAGVEPRVVELPGGGGGVLGSLRSLGAVLTGELTLGLAPCPLDSVVGLPRGVDVFETLGGLGLGGVEPSRREPPAGLVYGPGGQVLVGVLGDEGSAIGPLGPLLGSVIHYQAGRAGRGETPMLPVWLHPVTAAVIPARGEQVEYAMGVARELAAHGANVVVLEPSVGLGARIRWAGKRWVPYVAVVGPREERTGTVTVRRRWRPGEQEAVSPGALAREVAEALLSGGAQGRVWRVSPS